MLDRDGLRELFDYTTYCWAVFGNSARGLPEGSFTQPVAGSGWPALRNALFHITTAWDDWLIARTGSDTVVLEADAFETFDELDELRATLRGLMWRVLDETPDDVFSGERLDLGTTSMTRQEVIAHLLLHELRHHGDINTLLSQLGAAVPPSDYAVYRWFKQREQRRG
jgi:uncharacterized damage-inducible protein DinB